MSWWTSQINHLTIQTKQSIISFNYIHIIFYLFNNPLWNSRKRAGRVYQHKRIWKNYALVVRTIIVGELHVMSDLYNRFPVQISYGNLCFISYYFLSFVCISRKTCFFTMFNYWYETSYEKDLKLWSATFLCSGIFASTRLREREKYCDVSLLPCGLKYRPFKKKYILIKQIY